MGRISVELVPRSPEGLREDLQMIKENIHGVDLINIPDLLRFETRSWQGAAIAQDFYPAVMPHIRAIDVDLTQPLAMRPELRQSGITEVLVIEGDPPQDMSHKFYPTVTTDVIQKFHQEMPEVKVYVGIDQYRGSMRQGRWAFSPSRSLTCGCWRCMLTCCRGRMCIGVLHLLPLSVPKVTGN